MKELKNLDKLQAQARKIIEPYLNELLKIHQDNLVSIFVCGDTAGTDYVPKVSNITLLVILEKLEFQDLQKSLKLVSKGINKKISAPLFLTRKHMETSTDVFPVEFLEMKENHLLLYGEDLLSSLQVNPANIRLFCEEQIKGKLIRIRQAYLEIGLKRKGIEALLKESLASLTPIFRNLIRLKGKTLPVKKEEIYVQLSAEFDLDRDVFLAILRDTKNDEKISGQDVEVFFERYIAQIQKLAIAVDQL
jgi:DNA-binding transcriptional MerR regulator